MKKKLIFGALALFSTFCFAICNCQIAAAKTWTSYQNCIDDSKTKPWSNIPAVRDYVCGIQYNNSQNICAAWLGPIGNSRATSINVPTNSVSLDANGNPYGNVKISLYGMCTNSDAWADEVYIAGGDNGAITDVPTKFHRGEWGNPLSVGNINLSIGTFVEGLQPLINGDGSETYTRDVSLHRHYMGAGDDASDTRSVEITITIPNLAPTFAAESAVYAGVNSRKGQANTERVLGTGQDKVTLGTMAGSASERLGVVSEGAQVWAAFVHHTYASESGATATYSVSLSVYKEGEGLLDDTKIAENIEWTRSENYISGRPNLTFSDTKSDGLYLPNGVVNNGESINDATEINTYNQIKFKKSGSYTICETLTISDINTTACVKFVASNVDSSFAARSDVWSKISDADGTPQTEHETTTATGSSKEAIIDDTDKVFIFKEIVPEPDDSGNGSDASGDGDGSGDASGDSGDTGDADPDSDPDPDADSEEPETTYEPESFTFELTFAHTILSNKNFTSGAEEYRITYSGDGFCPGDAKIILEEDGDNFVKGPKTPGSNACGSSGSGTASFEPVNYGVTISPSTEFNKADTEDEGYFAPSIAEEFENVPFVVKQKFNVTIHAKNDNGDLIISGDNKTRDFEFCETLSFRGIETKVCEKIRVRLEECDPEEETCEQTPQKENTPVVESRARVSVDSFNSDGSSTIDVTTPSVSSGLAGDWRRDARASEDAEVVVRLANNATSQGSARIRVAFEHGVYLASTDPMFEGNVAYNITQQSPSGSSLSISGDTGNLPGSISLDYENAWQRGFLVKSGTSRLAYHSYTGNNAIWYDGQSIPPSGTNKCIASYPTGNPPNLNDIKLQNDCRFFYTPSQIQSNGISQDIAPLQSLRTVVLEVSGVGEYQVCETVRAGEGNNAVSSTACARVIVTSLDMGECESYAVTGGYQPGVTNVLSKVKRGDSGDDWRGNMNGNLAGAGIVYAAPGETINWLNCYFPGAQANANASVHKINGSYEDLTEEHTSGGRCPTWCKMEHGKKQLKFTTRIGEWTNNGVNFATTYNGYLVGFSNEYLLTTTSPSFWNGTPNFNGAKMYYSSGTVTSAQEGISYNSIGVGNTDIKQATNSRALTDNQGNGAGRGDVGRTYYDEITTQGKPIATYIGQETHQCSYSTGKYCDYHHTKYDTFNTGTVIIGGRMSTSEVRVPYNYINTTSVEITGPDNVVYAGDTVNVSKSQVSVIPRPNAATMKTYATQIPGGRASLIFYVTEEMPNGINAEAYQTDSSTQGAGACGAIVPESRYKSSFCIQANENIYDETGDNMLNPSGNHNGEEYNAKAREFEGNYNVFDAPAGDWFCAVLAIYPYTVSSDKDIDSLPHSTPKDGVHEVGYEGTKQWYVSAPSCLQIAKKPSFQVLGGSLFSNGSIETDFMRKSNLYSVSGYEYSPQGYNSDNGTFYSSWVEQSVVTNGTAKWLASGAATGKVNDIRERGANNKNFCDSWVPLSIANISDSALSGICTSGSENVQQTGLANITSKTRDREALVDFWKPTAGLTNANVISANAINLTNVTDGEGNLIGALPSPTGRNVYWLETDHDIAIADSGEITAGKTYILKNTNGTVTITKDIIYNSGQINSSASIPKVLIYARGNIDILCEVSRIDAILISGEGKVNTCSNGGDNVNSVSRDNQLIVNGVIIADTLELPRTYGAATGINSGTAAEMVNYDTSSILWGSFMSGAAESNTLVTVFTEELSPRY